MITSDLIAVGILVLCIALAMFGVLKWLFRFCAGVVLGLLVLSCIGLLADNPKFDQLSRGAFTGGKVIPCIRSQVRSVGRFLAGADQQPDQTVAMSE
ncbi:MAG: hypothetical protein ACYSWQ_04415 [Planctomycetota bacterium]|jgi:hypothetical protein